VRNFSNFTLCHKGAGEPVQALLWLVGHIDSHSLASSEPYGSWSITVRLPPVADNALNSLFKTGPYKTYTSPNHYALVKAKATVKSVQEDLKELDEEEPVTQLVADRPYPFTYDGTSLTDDWVLPDHGFDISNFKDQSSVGVEVSVLGYRIGDKEPGYSLGMRGVYHLGGSPAPAPLTPAKRKGGCLISPRRRKGALFAPDPSKAS